MKPGRKSLAAMLLLLVISAAVVWFGMGDEMKGARDMRFGIDIRGGVEAVFEPVGLDRAPTEAEVTAARNIMESRLDDRNILDREVTADTDRGYVIVRFPWKSGETQFNPEVAIAELGEMANLTFRDEAGTIMLEGKDVSTSSPVESGGNGPRQYAVELHFTEEGAEKFADATGKLTGQDVYKRQGKGHVKLADGSRQALQIGLVAFYAFVNESGALFGQFFHIGVSLFF